VTSCHVATAHGGTGTTTNPHRWARAGMAFLPNNLSHALGHGFSGGVLLVFLVLDLISLIWVPLGSSYITLLLGFFLVAGMDLLLIDPFLVLVLFLDLLYSLNSDEEKS
jgi:hypothetical protein